MWQKILLSECKSVFNITFHNFRDNIKLYVASFPVSTPVRVTQGGERVLQLHKCHQEASVALLFALQGKVGNLYQEQSAFKMPQSLSLELIQCNGC